MYMSKLFLTDIFTYGSALVLGRLWLALSLAVARAV